MTNVWCVVIVQILRIRCVAMMKLSSLKCRNSFFVFHFYIFVCFVYKNIASNTKDAEMFAVSFLFSLSCLPLNNFHLRRETIKCFNGIEKIKPNASLGLGVGERNNKFLAFKNFLPRNRINPKLKLISIVRLNVLIVSTFYPIFLKSFYFLQCFRIGQTSCGAKHIPMFDAGVNFFGFHNQVSNL